MVPIFKNATVDGRALSNILSVKDVLRLAPLSSSLVDRDSNGEISETELTEAARGSVLRYAFAFMCSASSRLRGFMMMLKRFDRFFNCLGTTYIPSRLVDKVALCRANDGMLSRSISIMMHNMQAGGAGKGKKGQKKAALFKSLEMQKKSHDLFVTSATTTSSVLFFVLHADKAFSIGLRTLLFHLISVACCVVLHRLSLSYANYFSAASIQSLLAKKASPNWNNPEDNGNTVLMLATKTNKAPVVRLLLEGKANPNMANNANTTPLHLACRHGRLNLVKLLILHKVSSLLHAFNCFALPAPRVRCTNHQQSVTTPQPHIRPTCLNAMLMVQQSTKQCANPQRRPCRPGAMPC